MIDVSNENIKKITFVLFVISCVLATLDIVADLRDGVALSHLVHELILWGVSLFAAILLYVLIKKQDHQIFSFSLRINELQAEKQNFKVKLSHFAGEFLKLVQEQFDQWNLTPGEKDVALLLLKGLSMKEIADLRTTNEATVRQQASSIYRKSGLGGRQELAAFFFDDLLVLKSE